MAKDYKNTPRPRDKTPKQAPGWVWLVTGLAIGLFVALLVYLRDYSPARDGKPVAGGAPAAHTESARADKKPDDKRPADKTASTDKPRFDFYNLLPEMEVLIPEQEIAKERERESSEHDVYFLQVASFKSFEEADRLRAQLAFMNLESHIQRITVNNRDQEQTWHRVRVGPFDSARKMDVIRNRLRQESLEPIVIKVKN